MHARFVASGTPWVHRRVLDQAPFVPVNQDVSQSVEASKGIK